MIETRRLKNIIAFFQIFLSFVLPIKCINVYNDLARNKKMIQLKIFVNMKIN